MFQIIQTYVIRKIDPSGNVTTYAGNGTAGSHNGQSTGSFISYGLVADSSWNV